MKVQHYVSYVVGMLLTFPIRVFHLLSPEGSGFAQEKKNPHEIKNYPTTKAENYSNMQGDKKNLRSISAKCQTSPKGEKSPPEIMVLKKAKDGFDTVFAFFRCM